MRMNRLGTEEEDFREQIYQSIGDSPIVLVDRNEYALNESFDSFASVD